MTIPPELDFSQVDLNDISTRGMLVNAEGQMITKVSDSDIPSWVMLEGCQYTGDSENFEQDLFEFTFKNVKNPSEEIATSEFSVNVFDS